MNQDMNDYEAAAERVAARYPLYFYPNPPANGPELMALLRAAVAEGAGVLPDPEVRSYLSVLIDTNDDGQEVEFGYDPDVRERAIAWLRSFDQH